jgi:hypothetical protein
MALGANIFASADVDGGSSSSSSSSSDVAAMYGPSRTGSSEKHPLHPSQSFGMGFWWGVGGMVALVLIRRSLPG